MRYLFKVSSQARVYLYIYLINLPLNVPSCRGAFKVKCLQTLSLDKRLKLDSGHWESSAAFICLARDKVLRLVMMQSKTLKSVLSTNTDALRSALSGTGPAYQLG